MILGSRVIGSFYQNGLKYSTVPREPDTHEDFRLTNKVQDSAAVSFKDIVEQENPVMIYMKGVPDFPQCGFSSLAVRALKHYNKYIPLSARNILENPKLKSTVKAFR
ncbi:Monothiol glutaredoxin-S15 [Hibiscus syriacus]|uniref:Monothiol glutaredoxin-S15 n=1 Tax=Hibiscus syriacus TaxID=106335 RepID=A0A6A3A2I8_HIBSY|nr:Monothiol glutaredoxin-S15 [Hibiscus syriacus]